MKAAYAHAGLSEEQMYQALAIGKGAQMPLKIHLMVTTTGGTGPISKVMSKLGNTRAGSLGLLGLSTYGTYQEGKATYESGVAALDAYKNNKPWEAAFNSVNTIDHAANTAIGLKGVSEGFKNVKQQFGKPITNTPAVPECDCGEVTCFLAGTDVFAMDTLPVNPAGTFILLNDDDSLAGDDQLILGVGFFAIAGAWALDLLKEARKKSLANLQRPLPRISYEVI